MEIKIVFNSSDSIGTVTIKEDDGSVMHKKLLNSVILDAFQKTSTKEQYHAVPPLLQKHLPFVEGLLYGYKDKQELKGIFFVQESIRFMNFSGEQLLIPYPSCLFSFTSNYGQLTSSKCYCVTESKMEDLHDGSQLFAYPFGNVDPYDAYICWGSNRLGILSNYQDLKNLIITFFSSESNADYATSGISFRNYNNYRDFLAMLCKKKDFPKDTLVPSKQTHTLGMLLNEVITNEENGETNELY